MGYSITQSIRRLVKLTEPDGQLLNHLVKYNQASNQLFGYVVISLPQSVPHNVHCKPWQSGSARVSWVVSWARVLTSKASSCLEPSAVALGALLHSHSFWNGSLQEVQPRSANCTYKHKWNFFTNTLYSVTACF